MNQLGSKKGGREGWKEEEGREERSYVGRVDGKKGWSEGRGKEGT